MLRVHEEMKNSFMNPSTIVVSQDSRLEQIKQYLTLKLSVRPQKIDAEDVVKIKDAIDSIKYPYPAQSMKDFLFYIDDKAAGLMALSKHPVVSEWGNKCKNFYVSDPLNKHVQPETGLVVAKRDGIDVIIGTGQIFRGQGVWHLSGNRWEPGPGSRDQTINGSEIWFNFNLVLNTGYGGIRYVYHPPIKPPNLSNIKLKLISPIHVAALIGDKKLMESLIAKGAKLDDDNNDWHVTPLEMAILSEHIDLVDFMCQKNINKAKGLKIAIEKSSFTMIEKLVNCGAPITDEVFEAAGKRDQKLHEYLVISRKNHLQNILTTQAAYTALQTILNYPEIPVDMLVDIICKFPDVINMITDINDGNTLLHHLVIENNPVKVKAFLSAIVEAKLLTTLSFDVEKTNKAGKTILRLALDSKNKDVISAVILYGIPKTTSVETEILENKIILPEIKDERARLQRELDAKMSRMLIATNGGTINNTINLAIVAAQQEAMAAQVKTLTQQNMQLMQSMQALLLQCQEFKRENAEIRALLQATRPDLALPAPAPESPVAQNRNHLFAVANNMPVSSLPVTQNDPGSGQVVVHHRQLDLTGSPR